MNGLRYFLLAICSTLPITSVNFTAGTSHRPDFLFIDTLSQTTTHGIATFDTKNHWIKFKALDDGIVLSINIHRRTETGDDLGMPKVIASLDYSLGRANDSIARILPSKDSRETTVYLETYDRDFGHYSYVFSY